MSRLKVTIMPSWRKNKKYVAVIEADKTKTVHFGDSRYEDYTNHKDPIRMLRYLERHIKEDWSFDNIASPAFWSRWLLWNLPSINDSIDDIEGRFPVDIYIGTK